MERILRDVWDSLRAKMPQYNLFVNSVTLENVRGIKELSVPFTYPVSVIAGANATGKTTIISALLCAYSQQDSNRIFPSSVFLLLNTMKSISLRTGKTIRG
jgi:AAA15 family ATPase/GTPase